MLKFINSLTGITDVPVSKDNIVYDDETHFLYFDFDSQDDRKVLKVPVYALGIPYSNLKSQSTNVQDAIDELFRIAKEKGLYKVPLKISSWTNGTDEEIANMVAAADAGEIDLSEYWTVGDTRTVSLSAMEKGSVGEAQPEQTASLVLLHQGLYQLVDPVKDTEGNDRSTCSFVVGLLDCLKSAGYMNYDGSWSGYNQWNTCSRRTWCNEIFRNAFPSTIRNIFKQFKCKTATTYNGNTISTTNDYFALAASTEIRGKTDGNGYPNLTERNALTQFSYYQSISSHRIKKRDGYNSIYFTRTPNRNRQDLWVAVDTSGNLASQSPNPNSNSLTGISPFGCI